MSEGQLNVYSDPGSHDTVPIRLIDLTQKTRDERLADLVAEGNPLALMLQDAGAWRISSHENNDGRWQVREFVWPSGEAARAAITALGLEE